MRLRFLRTRVFRRMPLLPGEAWGQVVICRALARGLLIKAGGWCLYIPRSYV